MARPDANNPLPANHAWPEGWEYRLDSPAPDLVVTADTTVENPDIYFTNMNPGWHVTVGSPRAIFWHPASTATGDYSVSSNFFLFDPGTRNEGYGLIVGGSDLSGPNQEYLYFLLRKSGEYLVKIREGETTRNVVGWTAHEAIAAWTDDSDGTIANVLGVKTVGDQVSFLVNDVEVHAMDKADLPTDGLVGFRVNHGLNVHISTFDIQVAGE